MVIMTKAPCRIDLAGSVTDVPQFCKINKGYVVNLAINRYVYCTYIESSKDLISVLDISGNIRINCTVDELPRHRYPGMIRSLVKRTEAIKGGIFIIFCDIPPGSGLASSGAVVTALTAIFSILGNMSLTKEEIAEYAFNVESEDINPYCGRQDSYASALGGINYFRFDENHVNRQAISLREDVLEKFLTQLAIINTGEDRWSGNLVKQMIALSCKGDALLNSVMEEHRNLAKKMYGAFQDNNLAEVGNLMNCSWENQERLLLPVTNNAGRRIMETSKLNGGLGVRLGGVGGGGFAIVLFESEQKDCLEKALKDNGWILEPVTIDWEGVSLTKTQF